MICAECGENTHARPCERCGAEPWLAATYRLERELGRGASGTTFAAVDVQTNARVAVKEMPIGRANTVKARALLDREARVLSELNHPAIPRFIASMVTGEGRGRAVVLVQALIDGEDLRTEMTHRRYTPTDVLTIASELLDVLLYLHSLSPPVIHRDLKPGNVMRRRDGRLALLDFGAVRDTLRDLDGSGSTVAGTFGYMAPEQLVGDASPMSDLYGLGALLVHLLSRIDPQQMLAVRGGLDWQSRVSVPAGIHALLCDLLEPDPDLRRVRLGSTAIVRDRVRALLRDPEGPRASLAQQPARALVPPASAARVWVGLALGTFAVFGGILSLNFAPLGRHDEAPTVAIAPAVDDERPLIEAVREAQDERIVPQQNPEAPLPEPVPVWVGDLTPLGGKDAPVHIVAFSDYQCPFCARALDGLREIVARREGLVSLHLRDFPLDFHKEARNAAKAARCADEQGALWRMHEALFAHSRTLDPEAIGTLAVELNLDMYAFRRCLKDEGIDAAITRDIQDGQAIGVNATPIFFVNGHLIRGAQPMSVFEDAIDRALVRSDLP